MVSELATNITHSHDLGFAIVQRYADSSSLVHEHNIVFAIEELGIGIEQSLKRDGSPVDPSLLRQLHQGSDYILQALQLGLTSRPSSARTGSAVGGIGLYRVREIVKEWHGSLTIRSYQSKIRISSTGQIIRLDEL